MPATDSESTVIAARLREAREYLEFTQEEVATALGCARTTVTEIEAGRRKVSAAELKRFARLYNRSTDWLVGEPELASAGANSALHTAYAQLSAADREQVLRFAEFLATATVRPTGN
ncbi:MAG: helix-turn-helix transcriptional regulator [Propionibacteriaceae bacterium]|jgi:transcriptional regulator with XRE-family HTH domain|nr:helix-turn-helix transcriptional regulator [Propionibacteriaceae bacterium]